MRVARETGAEAVFLSEDVSAYAQARERRLGAACDEARAGAARPARASRSIPPGDLAPAGAACYRVFTPYWRRWQLAPRRPVVRGAAADRRARAACGRAGSRRSPISRAERRRPSCRAAASRRVDAASRRWLARGLAHYGRLHDDLAADGTSRLGAYLHFGCLSPLEVAERAGGREGAEPFVRQLGWRDFYAQLLAERPETSRLDFRPRGFRWRDDAAGWRRGRRAARASRSSTPACGSSRARAGCTVARGCSPPPS